MLPNLKNIRMRLHTLNSGRTKYGFIGSGERGWRHGPINLAHPACELLRKCAFGAQIDFILASLAHQQGAYNNRQQVLTFFFSTYDNFFKYNNHMLSQVFLESWDKGDTIKKKTEAKKVKNSCSIIHLKLGTFMIFEILIFFLTEIFPLVGEKIFFHRLRGKIQ